MISTNEFKTGMTIAFDGQIFQILTFQHVKPGKGAAFVRTKLRNLRTGANIDYTFNAGEKVEQAMINKTKMQYLYADGNHCVFMNNESYEQIEIPRDQITTELRFLIEGMDAEVMIYNDSEILGVSLPDKVVLTIAECVPGVKGDTKTNASKDATLETGHMIKVPMFIEQGEKVIVSTETGEYVSRDK